MIKNQETPRFDSPLLSIVNNICQQLYYTLSALMDFSFTILTCMLSMYLRGALAKKDILKGK